MSDIQTLPRPLTDVMTAKNGLELGTTFRKGGKEYIFLLGVASTVAGSWVTYNPDDYSTALLTKANVDKLLPVAVALAATVASSYGWYQIFGKVTGLVLASCAQEVAIYSSATAGSLDDDSTSQTKINRTVVTTTRAGTNGTTDLFIMYPSAS